MRPRGRLSSSTVPLQQPYPMSEPEEKKKRSSGSGHKKHHSKDDVGGSGSRKHHKKHHRKEGEDDGKKHHKKHHKKTKTDSAPGEATREVVEETREAAVVEVQVIARCSSFSANILTNEFSLP